MIYALIALGYCFVAGISHRVCKHFTNDNEIAIPIAIFWPVAACISLGAKVAEIPLIIGKRIKNRIENKNQNTLELPEHIDNTEYYRKAKLLVENYEKNLPISER